MITANKSKDQVVIYTIHESDRGQKMRWLLEEMAVPYEVVLMNRQAMPEQYAEIGRFAVATVQRKQSHG